MSQSSSVVESELVRVVIREVIPDLTNGQFRIVLQDMGCERFLSIWVGYAEGNAIVRGLEHTQLPRPMTHDLLASMVKTLGARVERVVITDLHEHIFYAEIWLDTAEGMQYIDTRPSDAIALAVRLSSPLYIHASIADKMADELDELFDRLEPSETVH